VNRVLFSFLLLSAAFAGCFSPFEGEPDPRETSFDSELAPAGTLAFRGTVHGEVLFLQRLETRLPSHATFEIQATPVDRAGFVFLTPVAQIYLAEERTSLAIANGRSQVEVDEISHLGGVMPPEVTRGILGPADVSGLPVWLLFYIVSEHPVSLELQLRMDMKPIWHSWVPILANPEPITARVEPIVRGARSNVTFDVEDDRGVFVAFRESLARSGGGTRELSIVPHLKEDSIAAPYRWQEKGETEGCGYSQGIHSAVGSPTFVSGTLTVGTLEEAPNGGTQAVHIVSWRSQIRETFVSLGVDRIDIRLGALDACGWQDRTRWGCVHLVSLASQGGRTRW
jgi:hypothetical protein